MVSHRSLVRWFLIVGVLGAAGVSAYGQTCSGTTTVTCTSGTGASVVPNAAGWNKASVYPTQFTVSGATGTVTGVSLVLHGLAADGNNGTCLSSAAMMLVSPDNRTFEFLHDPGDSSCNGSGANLNNLALTIADASAFAMPSASTIWPVSSGPLSVKPGSISDSTPTTYPSPAPAVTLKAAPSGTATFTSAFTGAPANGVWRLYFVDETQGDNVSFTSWDMTLTVSASSTGTTTLVSSNVPSPALINAAVTYTATVSSGSGTPTGSVTFMDTLPGASPATLCNAVPLSGGSAACANPIAAEGNHVISAVYTPTGSFSTSSGAVTEVYRHSTTQTGPQFCNAGAINIPGVPANQAIYPSYVNVTGVSQSVANLSVQLKGLSGAALTSVQMMLVSPSGQAFEFLSEVGPGTTQSSVNVNFADNYPHAPQSALTDGASYGSTSYTTGDIYPPPAPSNEFIAAPGGGANARTFETGFAGATSNGNWLLYVHDNGGTGSAASLSGGWCVSLTTNTGTNTATAFTSGPNPSTTGSAVGFTATVTPAPNSGTVAFTEGGAQITGGPSSPVSVAGATAGFTSSTLSEGDHTLTASYSGVASFNPSFGTLVQRVNNAPAKSVTGSNAYMYCNAGAIAIPATNTPPNNTGAGSPNPSNMIIPDLPGTISSMTVTLNNYHSNASGTVSSLLVGPAATNAQSFDFFSGVGGASNVFGPGNLTFSDTAVNILPQTPFGAGTYKPTSYTPAATYTASPSGFYTLPAGPYQYAAPFGTKTFAQVFNGATGVGTWSLYFNESIHEVNGGASGWCLNFTENPVTGTGTTAHVGPAPSNHMKQGGTGSVTFSLLNNGNGPTGDPDGAHGMVVTGTFPVGLTFGTVPTGTPWNCTTVASALTCKSSNAISQGSNYPLLTVPVQVATNAPATVTVSGFTFAGAGMTAGTFASDTITIDPSPVLSIAKTHTGTFTQGQTATWNVQVTNNSATAAGATDGSTVTVSDTLPSGYTLATSSGSGWSCSGTTTITCTSTNVVAGAGGTFPLLVLTVNVPANSATSVSNAAKTFGGGDTTHTNLAAAASGSDNNVPVVQVPASITINGIASQSAQLNTAFGSLAVTVKDAASVVIPNYSSVVFTAPASGASGTFSTATNTKSVTTNGTGVADPGAFTANLTAGGPYALSVVAGSASTNFSLTNAAGTPTSMTANPGTTPQSTTVVTAFTNALAVTIRDANASPVPGVNVTFTAPGSGPSGLFTNSTATITIATNASGVAAAPFTANGTAGGPYTVTAAASGLTTVNFSLTNTAGAASSMTANPGTTPQSATISIGFANALAVTVKDAGSNPLSGISVTFTAPGTGASGKFSNSTTTITVATNGSGVASAPFTANATAGGAYTVTAAASGLTTVNFTLTNTVGAATTMTANPGTTPQSTSINTSFINPVAVTVKDAGNNPLSGVNVTFTAPGSGASGIFSNSTTTITVATNASGIASAPFTANGTVGGPYTVTATSAGLTMVNFSLTNTPTGGASSMTANPGTTPQSAAINTAFINALAVTVKDGGSNPVLGVNVTFTAPGSGASGLFSNSTATITVATNASGVASAPITANGTAGGPYTVTAASAGLTMVNFSLTNTSVVLPPTVTNISSTVANGTYGTGATVPITVSFSTAVNVTGTPMLALNSGGTATYSSGSGTSTLTFIYVVGAGQSSPDLDYTSVSALTLNGGTIQDSNNHNALLTLPAPGAAGSLGANKNIVINTNAPTVVSFSLLFGTNQSYNVIGNLRAHLPWQVTGIRVVFSAPITGGDLNSLTGVTPTGFSGLGTNTLTWSIAPMPLGNISALLAGSGPDDLIDAGNNPLGGGAGYTQNFKVLWADINDDGVVNASDLVLVNAARSQPYNIFADVDGNGVVDTTDVSVARSRVGTSLP